MDEVSISICSLAAETISLAASLFFSVITEEDKEDARSVISSGRPSDAILSRPNFLALSAMSCVIQPFSSAIFIPYSPRSFPPLLPKTTRSPGGPPIEKAAASSPTKATESTLSSGTPNFSRSFLDFELDSILAAIAAGIFVLDAKPGERSSMSSPKSVISSVELIESSSKIAPGE